MFVCLKKFELQHYHTLSSPHAYDIEPFLVFSIHCLCSASLKTYAHDDVSIGSWMMGVQATYIDDNRFCCGSIKQGELAAVILMNRAFFSWAFSSYLKDNFSLADKVCSAAWSEDRRWLIFYQDSHPIIIPFCMGSILDIHRDAVDIYI